MTEGVDQEELERLRVENAALEKKLANEVERFAALVRSSPIALALFSFEEVRFIEVNDRYLELIGTTREEMLRRDPYELWTSTTYPEDFEAERALVQRMVDGETNGYRLKKRFVRGGELRWVDFASESVRDERGRLRYSIIQVVDVHDFVAAQEARDRLEERLRQAQKLETVGRLVGGVAHDFNNRLLVIMGYAELLKRGTVGDPELESHADVVLTSARRAADLTHQLLAYGRRQVLKPRSVDLNTVVDRMRRMLERVLGESIELVTVLGTKQSMFADSGQIEQVLMNLVLNARDAMPSGGRITIETADVVVGAEQVADLVAGSYVTLSVTDTGTGVPEAVRERIFEPFFTTKDVGKGTGLGLAMVDGVVRQSGGVVSMRSSEGRGATFTVYLPQAKDKTSDAPAPQAAPVAKLVDVETVLVVDDEDDVRRLLVDVLEIGAYRVLEARDGERALELAEEHGGEIALLITDVAMPKMKGSEVAARLRERHPDVLTLYVSGYAESESLRTLGANEHFLAKPFLAADLFRIVRDVLASRSAKGVERAG